MNLNKEDILNILTDAYYEDVREGIFAPLHAVLASSFAKAPKNRAPIDEYCKVDSLFKIQGRNYSCYGGDLEDWRGIQDDETKGLRVVSDGFEAAIKYLTSIKEASRNIQELYPLSRKWTPVNCKLKHFESAYGLKHRAEEYAERVMGIHMYVGSQTILAAALELGMEVVAVTSYDGSLSGQVKIPSYGYHLDEATQGADVKAKDEAQRKKAQGNIIKSSLNYIVGEEGIEVSEEGESAVEILYGLTHAKTYACNEWYLEVTTIAESIGYEEDYPLVDDGVIHNVEVAKLLEHIEYHYAVEQELNNE